MVFGHWLMSGTQQLTSQPLGRQCPNKPCATSVVSAGFLPADLIDEVDDGLWITFNRSV